MQSDPSPEEIEDSYRDFAPNRTYLSNHRDCKCCHGFIHNCANPSCRANGRCLCTYNDPIAAQVEADTTDESESPATAAAAAAAAEKDTYVLHSGVVNAHRSATGSDSAHATGSSGGSKIQWDISAPAFVPTMPAPPVLPPAVSDATFPILAQSALAPMLLPAMGYPYSAAFGHTAATSAPGHPQLPPEFAEAARQFTLLAHPGVAYPFAAGMPAGFPSAHAAAAAAVGAGVGGPIGVPGVVGGVPMPNMHEALASAAAAYPHMAAQMAAQLHGATGGASHASATGAVPGSYAAAALGGTASGSSSGGLPHFGVAASGAHHDATTAGTSSNKTDGSEAPEVPDHLAWGDHADETSHPSTDADDHTLITAGTSHSQSLTPTHHGATTASGVATTSSNEVVGDTIIPGSSSVAAQSPHMHSSEIAGLAGFTTGSASVDVPTTMMPSTSNPTTAGSSTAAAAATSGAVSAAPKGNVWQMRRQQMAASSTTTATTAATPSAPAPSPVASTAATTAASSASGRPVVTLAAGGSSGAVSPSKGAAATTTAGSPTTPSGSPAPARASSGKKGSTGPATAGGSQSQKPGASRQASSSASAPASAVPASATASGSSSASNNTTGDEGDGWTVVKSNRKRGGAAGPGGRA